MPLLATENHSRWISVWDL